MLVAACVLLVLPPAALAHGGGSEGGYLSTVERIVRAQGIEAAASGDGHFSFTAPAGKTVVVRGYAGEAYLRFRNGKVYENRTSPTAYVNRDRPPLTGAMADVKERWRLVGDGRTYTWDDRRTRWTAATAPAAVDRAPDRRHHISDWRIGGTVDGTSFTIHGSLDWAPAKSGMRWQWALVPILGAAALYALFLTFASRPRAAPVSRPR